jgi:hypothetical protein
MEHYRKVCTLFLVIYDIVLILTEAEGSAVAGCQAEPFSNSISSVRSFETAGIAIFIEIGCWDTARVPLGNPQLQILRLRSG